MRLINTTDLELCSFQDPNEIPRYAILSHTWGDDENEVSLQDFRAGIKKDSSGYKKIVECCRLAQERSIHWAWIDTVCIDKLNGPELTEGINSMYNWYKRSVVCFAFLSDVPSHGASGSPVLHSNQRDSSSSRWFTRGWTLQELLAPTDIIFFNQNFQPIGSRTDLKRDIFRGTGIATSYLDQTETPQATDTAWDGHGPACIAERMSCVSRRQTKRAEDIAYCLLGIFDVNMPLLYGEGREKAFYRLQEQIISQSDDESIFVWKSFDSQPRGILAEDPAYFQDGGSVRVLASSIQIQQQRG